MDPCKVCGAPAGECKTDGGNVHHAQPTKGPPWPGYDPEKAKGDPEYGTFPWERKPRQKLRPGMKPGYGQNLEPEKRKIVYETLLEFCRAGGTITRARREKIGGVGESTIARIYKKGLPEQNLEAIQTIIFREQTLARARLALAEKDTLDAELDVRVKEEEISRRRAEDQRAGERAETAVMARTAKHNCIRALHASAQMLESLLLVLPKFEQGMRRLSEDTQTFSRDDLKDVSRFFREIVKAGKDAHELGRHAVQLERDLLGESPESTVNVNIRVSTPHDVQKQIDLARRNAERSGISSELLLPAPVGADLEGEYEALDDDAEPVRVEDPEEDLPE